MIREEGIRLDSCRIGVSQRLRTTVEVRLRLGRDRIGVVLYKGR